MSAPKKENPFTKARLNMQARLDKKLNKKKSLSTTGRNASADNSNKSLDSATNYNSTHTFLNFNKPGTSTRIVTKMTVYGHFLYSQKTKKPILNISGSKVLQKRTTGLKKTPKTFVSWKRNNNLLVRWTGVESAQKWSQRYNKTLKQKHVKNRPQIQSFSGKKKTKHKRFFNRKRATKTAIISCLVKKRATRVILCTNAFHNLKKTGLFAVSPRSYYTIYLHSFDVFFNTYPGDKGLGCSFYSNGVGGGNYTLGNHTNLSFTQYLRYARSASIRGKYLRLLQTDYKEKVLKLPRRDFSQPINQARLCFWDSFYNTLPLSSFMEKKVTVINYNIANVIFDKDFTQLLKRALRYFPFMQLNRVAAKLIASLFSILVLKDSKALSTFIQTITQKEHYKKHNMFFGFAGQLVTDVLKPWLHHFHCLGVSVTFRGKLAVGGNSRKRSLKYKAGMLSSSSKYIKINRTFAIIRTKTGSVGFIVTVAW